MLTASRTMAQHHRLCEELFVKVRAATADASWSLMPAVLGALREAILEHFRHEEQRIFPLYEQASGEEGATEALCAQHDDIRAALWVLGTLRPEADPQRFRAELADLDRAFAAHAAYEEERMYPVFERVLGDKPGS